MKKLSEEYEELAGLLEKNRLTLFSGFRVQRREHSPHRNFDMFDESTGRFVTVSLSDDNETLSFVSEGRTYTFTVANDAPSRYPFLDMDDFIALLNLVVN